MSAFPRSLLCLLLLPATVAAGQSTLPLRQLREELRIVSSETTPGMALTPVASLIELPDGRMVTLHTAECVLRVFDASGKLLRLVGRKGAGPGEFNRPTSLGLLGDTLWVKDDGARRYVLFSPTFTEVGVVRWPTGVGTGSALGLTSGTTSLYHSWTDTSHLLAEYDRDGRLVRPFPVTFRQSPGKFTVMGPQLNLSGYTQPGSMVPRPVLHPHTAATLIMSAQNAREALVLEAAPIWGGKPGEVQVRRLSFATGRLSPPVTIALPAHRITPAVRDSILTAAAARSPAPAEFRAKARVPEYFPAFVSGRASADGLAWLDGYGEYGVRQVIDFVAGKAYMRVAEGPGVSFRFMSRTRVWAVLRDQDDLPIIVRYRIQ
jgi:hypothetical protein